MRRLLALLTGVGAFVIGGVTYRVFRPAPGVSAAELLDAGIEDYCVRALVECDGRVAEECRDLPDGGRRRRYATVRMGAYSCERDGGAATALVFRPPRCFEFVSEDLCRVLEPDSCSDPQACGDDGQGPRWRAVQAPCACRIPGQMCRFPNPDGGLGLPMELGATYRPPWTGPGCQPKACVELAGEQGQSWPDECLLPDGGAP